MEEKNERSLVRKMFINLFVLSIFKENVILAIFNMFVTLMELESASEEPLTFSSKHSLSFDAFFKRSSSKEGCLTVDEGLVACRTVESKVCEAMSKTD